MRHRFTPVLAVLAFGAAWPAQAQARFDVYVALGDSLTAGFVSGSLVETHQKTSYPALIALAAGVKDFQQPTISEPGIPAELTLVSLSPGPLVEPKSATTGSPTNLTLPRAYNNLGVPGAEVLDTLGTITDGGGFHDLILRGKGTAVQQAVSLNPTFITLWIGNNDALEAVLQGRAVEGDTLTPVAKFSNRFSDIVSTLKTTGAQIVAANIPDVTTIPFVTTIPPVVVDPTTRQPLLVNGQPVPLMGPNGSLASNAYVLLSASSLIAQGIGIPKSVGGQGTPLPDQVILDADEVGSIQDHVSGYNAAIADICGKAGIAVFDVNAVFRQLATEGRDVGGIHLTTDYLTGGLFSYDGIHPTDLGYAILANEWIAKINAGGANLPIVNLGAYLGVSPSARRSVTPVEFTEAAYRSLLTVFPHHDQR